MLRVFIELSYRLPNTYYSVNLSKITKNLVTDSNTSSRLRIWSEKYWVATFSGLMVLISAKTKKMKSLGNSDPSLIILESKKQNILVHSKVMVSLL